MMAHPLGALPASAFWRKGVADLAGESHADLYSRKWPITREMRITTAGSCFAQHIGRNLRTAGFNVVDMEPPPACLPKDRHADYGFGIYSARYGNVYTARQMLQLAQEAFGFRTFSSEVWEKNGRYYDALRPTIEPQGFSAAEVVRAHRRQHLAMVRQLLEATDLLIFTLGLTEAWENAEAGTVYPVSPGLNGLGNFDPNLHKFHNFRFHEIWEDLQQLREFIHSQQQRRRAKILLTVSPVPLTATFSGKHVMQATVQSKATLRTVAGEMAAAFPDVDYFPSFEIIANPWRWGTHYEANLRSVARSGVDTVMGLFMASHGGMEAHRPSLPTEVVAPPTAASGVDDEMAVVCDEELLDAFGTRS